MQLISISLLLLPVEACKMDRIETKHAVSLMFSLPSQMATFQQDDDSDDRG